MMNGVDLETVFQGRGLFGIGAHFVTEVDEFFTKTVCFFADFGVGEKGVTESFSFAYFACNHF